MCMPPPPLFSKYVYGEPAIPSFFSGAQMEYRREEKMMLPTPPPSATTHNMPVAYIIIRRSKSEKRASLTLCPNMNWPRLHWQIGAWMTTWVADKKQLQVGGILSRDWYDLKTDHLSASCGSDPFNVRFYYYWDDYDTSVGGNADSWSKGVSLSPTHTLLRICSGDAATLNTVSMHDHAPCAMWLNSPWIVPRFRLLRQHWHSNVTWGYNPKFVLAWECEVEDET